MRRALSAVLAAGALSIAACGSSEPQQVRGPLRVAGEDGSVAAARLGTTRPAPFLLQVHDLCTLGAPVTVDSITLNEGHGIALLDWGLRIVGPESSVDSIGGDYGVLSRDLPSFSRATPVDVPCTRSRRVVQVEVEVERTAPIGTARGFVVGYAGAASELIPFTVTMCRRVASCPPPITAIDPPNTDG